VGALAAIGLARARVYAKPRVSILTTGDEVVPPGHPIRAGQVYDINSNTIASIVRENGGDPILLGRAPDRLEALRDALRKAVVHDLVVLSGGSSVGRKDIIVDVLRSMGDLLFHGIAVKPGKPTALARVRGKAVLGMPGNPTSCLSNGYVILGPMLRHMARQPLSHETIIEMPLAKRLITPTGRVKFHTVRVVDGRAVPAYKESSAITSMAHADGYIEIPADVHRMEKGEIVRVVRF
jgi:molybdenum cofactor synthesis domain-containing protein